MAKQGKSQLTDDERIFPEEVPPPKRETPPALYPLVAIWRAIRDWWQGLFVLTVASLIASALVITVVASAPAIGALMLLARASILHDQPSLMTFFTALRGNFLRAWKLGAVGLLTVVIIYADVPFYYQVIGQGGMLVGVLTLLVFYVLLLWFQTFSYAWAMFAVREDLNTKDLLRNGLLLALRYPVHNLISTLFAGVLVLASVYLPPLLLLIVPAILASLALRNLYLLAPEVAPEDMDTLRLVE